MTKLPCGCDEKEVIIGNIKGAINALMNYQVEITD